MSEEILIQNMDPDEVVVLDPDNCEELLLGVDSIVILSPSSKPLVTSVNGQTGPVVLGAADVGADPAGVAALLIAQITAASIGAATATQGAKADAALAAIDAPAAVRDTLLTGLSVATATPVVPTDTVLTGVGKLQAQLNLKLDAADYNDRFLGLFSSVFDLEAAHPTASAGDYAQVDFGIGMDVIIYAWDVSDAQWSAVGSGAIANTDALPEGSSNLYHTSQRVRDTPLTGLSTASATPITSADTVLSAAGKLQAQATDTAALLPQPFYTSWYKTGYYYDAAYPYYTTIAPTTGAAGVLYLCKRKILDDVTFNALSVNMTTAAAGNSSVFYGVYASDASGLPSTLLASGSASSATTGVKSTAVTLALTKGQVVWDACLCTGASVSVTGFQPIFQDGTGSPVASGTVMLIRGGQTSLPADASVIGAFTWSTTSRIPRVALRAA